VEDSSQYVIQAVEDRNVNESRCTLDIRTRRYGFEFRRRRFPDRNPLLSSLLEDVAQYWRRFPPRSYQ
jgi:hypothetical protein